MESLRAVSADFRQLVGASAIANWTPLPVSSLTDLAQRILLLIENVAQSGLTLDPVAESYT